MLNRVRTVSAVFRGGRPVTSRADTRRSLPYCLVIGAAAAIAMVAGGEFADSTGARYPAAVAAALAVLVLPGLLVNRLLWIHPTVRRGIWCVMLALVVTMGIDSSFAALPAELAAVVGASLAFALAANRVLDGAWLPAPGTKREEG